MYLAPAFTVAPVGHDKRTRENPGPLPLGPADCLDERRGIVRFPVGEQELGFRRQGVNYFAAKNAVLAVARFEVAIASERCGHDMGRQLLAQKVAVTSKAAVEDGDFGPLPSKT